ncbi:MAG: DUF4147 domain-containing protein, partial [Myxococcales bacterium]|nr:DUF4147 domain-containing protein [Myxococcales bacterium]
DAPLGSLEVHVGGHPLPRRDADVAGRRVAQLAQTLTSSDTALVLMSGGASAMLEWPMEGVSIELLQSITETLQHASAPIEDLNSVRRALSRLKGGKLATLMHPARIVNIVLSDVPGSPPSIVGSGPTCWAPMAHPNADAVRILKDHDLWAALPDGVRKTLSTAPEREPEAPSPTTIVAADNPSARRAMVQHASERGLRAIDGGNMVRGEASKAGAEFVRDAHRQDADVIIGGGETTVTVRGKGRGGRNQEFVLGATQLLGSGLVASMGTDGIDGNSHAAGALIDPFALQKAQNAALDPDLFLSENNSEAYFRETGTALITGPTGTNVADLCLFLR